MIAIGPQSYIIVLDERTKQSVAEPIRCNSIYNMKARSRLGTPDPKYAPPYSGVPFTA